MRRLLTTWAAGLATLGLLLAGCGDQTEQRESSANTRHEAGRDDSADQDTGSDGASDNDGATSNSDRAESDSQQDAAANDQPELVGKGLAIAQDRAEDAGYEVQAYDSTGRDRTPVLGRSWQVCFQEPARSTENGEVIRVGVVRTSEQCPDQDGSRNQPELGPDNELPDFGGTSLHVATDALGADASVHPVDARGDRNIYIPQNWKVCDQSPAPGTSWDGEPITFEVVKYGERCP